MRLTPTPAENAIRDEVRAVLADRLHELEDVPTNLEERIPLLRAWQRQLAEAGLVGRSWPREVGGGGGTLLDQVVINQELALAGAPEIAGSVGVEVVGPSIVAFGTARQRDEYLRPLLRGDEIWCQGFSEPGAGSDLASLRTTAVLEGDEYVLRGQKTWTSLAQFARWCAVLARTDPDAPPHRGITYLLVDLRSAGIDIRPMRQITGDAEFSEVFFDDVRVPAENVLGAPGQGWSIAMHTLSHERGPYAFGRQVKLRTTLDRLVEDAGRRRRDGRRVIDDPAARAALARAHTEIEVLRHHCCRSIGRTIATGDPGVGSSVDKLFLATAEQALGAACLEVLGPDVTALDETGEATEWQHTYLYGRAASIYGGTAQVQRGIIAQRTLGLPRSN